MSFNSSYLKLRKERAGTSSGGTKQNAAPPEEQNTAASESSFNQNYMALRNKRSSMTISEKVEKRVQALKKKQGATSPADVLEGRKTGSKSYYTRPEFGTQNERLYGSVTALDAALAEKRTPLETAVTALRKAESDLKTTQGYVTQARAAYEQDPSEENAAYYNQVAGAYEQARQSYNGAFDAYSAAFSEYEPYEAQLVDALTAYQLYNEQQNAAFDDWRGTIRDAAAIRQEIEAADAGIAELESRIGTLEALTRGPTDALGDAHRESLRKATEELQAMQQSRALLQEELDWSQHYQYADLMDAADFGTMSAYASTANGKEAKRHPLSGLYTETGFDDLTYDYINRNEAARGKALVSSIADNTALLGLDTSYLEQMTDDEIAIFNYLYATQGADAAYEYTAYLTTTLTQRQRMAKEAQWAQYAAANPVAASAFSVAMSPLKGVSFLGQAADKATDGTIDQNAAYNKFSYAGSAIRNQVAEQIEKSGKWGPIGSFAYQTGMSMGDFLLNTAITGGNQTLSLAIMGSGAAADTVIAGKDRGLSDDQAFTLGAVAGLAEIAMEKISLDTLLNPSLLRNGSVKYVLKNMVAEGSEEVGTDLINLFADILIAKDQSEWQQSIDSYAAQGMSEKEAFGAALKDQLLTMGADFLGGALSGGIMSGAGAIAGNRFTNKQAQELEALDLSDEDIQLFIETGLESAPDTDAYHIAQEMQQKLEAGQELSSNDLSRLYQANIQAVYEEQQTEEQPQGLTLRSVDTEETAPAPVTQSQGAKADNNAAPWQQEPEWNGGTVHGEYEQSGRSAAAQPGIRRAAGEYVPDGSGERPDGAGAGEQAGILAGGTGGAARRRGANVSDTARAAVARQNLARNLRLEKVSSLDLGLSNGTEVKNVQVMPMEHWDEEMGRLAYRVYQETGRNVTFVMGRIQIRTSGGIGYARGVITPDRLIVQADNLNVDTEKITDHELYHAKTDFAAEMGGDLTAEIRDRVLERFTEDEFSEVLDRYIEALRGVIDVAGAQSIEEYTRAVRQVEEELLADAYAGINAFGAGADKFTEVVNESMDRIGMGKRREQDNDAVQPTGPPSDRYSYAGENANNADLDALARAKEMQAAGVAEEPIRQQTGWHVGMDGKWRWEIDDSRMRYDSSGDMRGAESARWAREDYENARADLWENASEETLSKVRAYNRADMEGDETRKQELYDELIAGESGFYFDLYLEAMEAARKSQGAPAGGTLQDYIDHPELFEAYPQLKDVTLRFERMSGGTKGYFNRADNAIAISQELRYAPEETLIHEIQHAIQKAEGFTHGASPEMWGKVQESDAPVTSYGEQIRDGESNLAKILDEVPPNIAEQFRLYSELDKTDPARAAQLLNELSSGPYAKRFYDYVMLEMTVDGWRQFDRPRGKRDLYENTAGEIEARDAGGRLTLGAAERRATQPARADKNTVFAEDGEEQLFGERFSVDDVDSMGNELSQAQREFFEDSKVRDARGRLMVLYHQTDGDFTVFDTRHPGAGRSDGDTPFGIFLKRSAGDIGLAGKRQMELYANIKNPLRATSREDLVWQLRRISDSYADISEKHKQLDAEYHEKFEQAKKAWRDYVTAWRAANPGASRRALNNDPKFNELYDAEDAVVDEWTAESDRLSAQAKEAITEDLRKAGYDGVFLENDMGSWGRRTDAIIALSPNQVKNTDNRNPTEDPDIRFSIDADGREYTFNDIGALQQERYQLQAERRKLLEANPGYAAATEKRRYATTFKDRIEASKALRAAEAEVDTARIDQRIAEIDELVTTLQEEERIRHQRDQEKYSGTKTSGYALLPDTRTHELDAEYEKAVKSGNRKRMEALVQQAAEAAMQKSVVRGEDGKLLKVYHYTNGKFTNFDRGMARTGNEMDGFFFAPDPESSKEYGDNVIVAYLNITNLAKDPYLDRLHDDSGTLLREKLAYEGYDGVARTEADGSVYEYMAFDPEQIKSAEPVAYDDKGKVIPLSERFDFGNADVRYSIEEEADPKKQSAKKKVGPIAESRPIIAKRNLKNAVLNTFSIPSGMRAAMGDMIDLYADRLLKNGSLSEEDRQFFFDRLYESGVMTMPADEYYAEARNYMKGGRIYVSDDVVADLGDDWNDIRKRAFAAGLYLTRSQVTDGHQNTGIDVWNGELATDLPGLFDSEETDQRTILERIIWVAEAGKEEQLSLQEYTARLAQEEYVSEDEILDNMERQMDWALRTFAESARLEIKLRDRTGVKIAEERGKATWRAEQQRAKESKRRADERQARKESAQRQKERRELRELQQKTLKQLQWLSKNRNRAPEELKETWNEVLGDIDLYAVGAANEMRWSDKHGATWKDLAQMYKDAQKNDPNFLPSKELERIVARLDGTKIAEMDVGALQDLYKAAIGLRTEFYNRNNVINDEMQRLFAEVYSDVKREMEEAPGGFTGGVMDKLMNLDQLTPMNVMQRMAGWDPDSAFFSMAKQLERGERDMRAYSVKAQKMLQDFLTEHEEWAMKADGQGEDAIWYEVEVPQLLELGMGDKPIFGETVKVYMTPAQKVHMYLESKNLDNLRHMTGGRTFANRKLYSEGKRQEALSQGRTIRLAPETVRKLVSDLTPEEMELARILDRYYNTFATQEINKVSNILYGYDKAMGKNYAPIYTNRNYTKTEFGVFDTTAEGVGNLKGRQYAVNPSYNISAFDAFERHVDQTARFCGMAIPARNWTTLMNWREQNNSTGDVITHKWGEESKRYITDLITTLQGGDSAKTDTLSAGVSKLQSNYITAIFGANPSIVLKQLGSIPLAGAYLDARNVPTLAQIQGIDRDLIGKYTQELEWRTMGYTTPETKQLKDNPNWTQTNKTFKFIFGGGAITAMDGWAASTLWPWAENKVRREHPELEMGTEKQVAAGESPFYKKVAEEFENALTRSQSVSDEIHQGSLRKSKNPITKAFTMFRSDSAQTYNALRQKIGEAQFYARTGAKDEVIDAAKKAVGAAFTAMMINAAWAEAINFLMALWKNKGKYYRDDDDELTILSAGGEMISGMLGSFAGVVTGGEELFDIVGNLLTGDTWYGIDTPGMEQLNDLIDTVTKAGGDLRDVVAGGWDILKNGGNLGTYFGKHSGEILGGIKDLAEAAAMYLPGLPVSNMEAYLLGAVKWVSPELGAAYDDLFSDVGKSDLAGAEGRTLQSRIGGILSGRNISESHDTAEALAALYEAGHKTAVPGDTPTSISVDGEKRALGAHQQQAYDTIWGGVVADALDDIVASEVFAEADAETQAKMLSNLYSYAAERAKMELFDDYEPDSGAVKNAAIVAAGASVAECITWNTITSGMKSAEKSAELAAWDLPDPAKRAIFLNKISDSREDTITAFSEAGLTFDQFLQAYSKYGEINAMDLKASGKALEFAHWTNGQGYSEEQAAVVKDELTYFNMTPASSTKYEKLVDAGMDPEDAYDLAGELNGLQAEDGADSVSDLQKWRASVDFSDDVEDQLTALYAVMTEAQYQKVEIAHSFGVSPDAYVTLQEVKPRFDANGNGSYTNAEIKAAVDSMGSRCTKEQKAVLWQLATGSKSAKNNPYSPQIGQKVLDAKAAAKEAAAQEEELEGLTLGNW